ncbi:MAG TPA: patatin-like phospholipase family protein [Candidatus Limnocylindria bacterium]|nr:patatin-like phospholipase family protein [Candidatus Limnocylindria bacterium]
MSPRRVRRGLVLGAGGVLGAAWTIGALKSLEEVEGFDARDAEMIVGTSAGSVIASLLGSGVSVPALLDHQLGRPVTEGPLAGYSYDYDKATGGALPGRPKPGIGSRTLLLRAMREPRKVPPMAVMSSVLPVGRGSLWSVPHLVDAITPSGEWSPHPALWIVAMDYETGRRVAFGREGAPETGLSEAVLASCSIPGWYAPVTIGGRRYVDGGTCSATSVDLLADSELDEVFVLAPMASFDYDRPSGVAARVERGFRRTVTRRMLSEAAKVRRTGGSVTMLGPGRVDLEAIGANLMDPSRRVAVLETAVRTSAEALRRARADELSWG